MDTADVPGRRSLRPGRHRTRPTGWRCSSTSTAQGVSIEQMRRSGRGRFAARGRVRHDGSGPASDGSSSRSRRAELGISVDLLRRVVARRRCAARRRRLPRRRRSRPSGCSPAAPSCSARRRRCSSRASMGSSMAGVADAAISLFLVERRGSDRCERVPTRDVAGRGGRERRRRARRDPAAHGRVLPGHVQARDQPAAGVDRVRRRIRACSGWRSGSSISSASRRYPRTLVARRARGLRRELREPARTTIVPARGGRVVKHIGDEVMFVDGRPGRRCATSRCELVETLRRATPASSPHAGVGFGPLVGARWRLLRLGGEPRVAHRRPRGAGRDAGDRGRRGPRPATDAELAFEPAGRRQLKGFAEPVPLWSVS